MASSYTSHVVLLANAGEDDETGILATVTFNAPRPVAASFDCPAYGGDIEILKIETASPAPNGWTEAEFEDWIEASLNHADLLADASDTDDYAADCAAEYRREQMQEAR